MAQHRQSGRGFAGTRTEIINKTFLKESRLSFWGGFFVGFSLPVATVDKKTSSLR